MLPDMFPWYMNRLECMLELQQLEPRTPLMWSLYIFYQFHSKAQDMLNKNDTLVRPHLSSSPQMKLQSKNQIKTVNEQHFVFYWIHLNQLTKIQNP